MEKFTPEQLDRYLSDILNAATEKDGYTLSADDREFIDRIIRTLVPGSKALFIAVHPDNRLQYFLHAMTKPEQIIALISTLLTRLAERESAG